MQQLNWKVITLYGADAGLVFVPIYNFVARRCGEPQRSSESVAPSRRQGG